MRSSINTAAATSGLCTVLITDRPRFRPEDAGPRPRRPAEAGPALPQPGRRPAERRPPTTTRTVVAGPPAAATASPPEHGPFRPDAATAARGLPGRGIPARPPAPSRALEGLRRPRSVPGR